MTTIEIADELRRIIDQQVAEGRAANAAELLDEAVRRYVEDLDRDEAALIAAAREGLAAVEEGDYVTISGPKDLAALRDRLWERAAKAITERDPGDPTGSKTDA